jgi:hypothetical protein
MNERGSYNPENEDQIYNQESPPDEKNNKIKEALLKESQLGHQRQEITPATRNMEIARLSRTYQEECEKNGVSPDLNFLINFLHNKNWLDDEKYEKYLKFAYETKSEGNFEQQFESIISDTPR